TYHLIPSSYFPVLFCLGRAMSGDAYRINFSEDANVRRNLDIIVERNSGHPRVHKGWSCISVNELKEGR
ncbi:MAG TPA: hypothetical protein PKY90_04290, partial [Bacillota bacterium]|nr:hypothetical protein [Bacillota bacterium]HPZ78208.1 hypothetical protein [Bacillota bacterium]